MYTAFMYNIWMKRKRILKDYFTSIGIIETYEEQEDQEYPQEIAIAMTGFSPYCLK